MNGTDIAIIVNSFNRLALLRESLGALAAWLPSSDLQRRCVVVVYEAGSTDGSIPWLKEEAPRLGLALEVLIAMEGEDNSFAAGLNTAVDFAGKHYPSLRYLLFYETDNQILEAQPLLQAMRQLVQVPRLAACGFTVRKHDGSPAGVGQPFPSLLNFMLGKNIVHRFQLEAIRYRWQKDRSGIEFSEVDVVYTSPLLVRMDAWCDSGGLDAATFPFSDCDVDWARRLYNLGWRIGVVRTDAVIHDNREMLSTWSKSRALQAHRGRLRYFYRHNPVAVFAVWPAFLILRHLAEWVMVKLTVREPERRKQLSWQFLYLLKTCSRKYE